MFSASQVCYTCLMPVGSTSGRTQTITIRVGPNLRSDLESRAASREMSISELVRYAVNYYLDAVPEKRAA